VIALTLADTLSQGAAAGRLRIERQPSDWRLVIPANSDGQDALPLIYSASSM
jgi:hypothetical protein